MSGTTTDKGQTTFPVSSIQSLQSEKTPSSFSAQIIREMSKVTGHSIEKAARVMDGFWDYVSNHRVNWRKDTHCLQIPKFGTFILKPRSKNFIKKQKIGKMKFLKSQFIYRDKEGKWTKNRSRKSAYQLLTEPLHRSEIITLTAARPTVDSVDRELDRQRTLASIIKKKNLSVYP